MTMLLAALLAGAAGFVQLGGGVSALSRLAVRPAVAPAGPRRLVARRARAATAGRATLAELLDGLAAEIRSGAELGPALAAAASGLPGLDDVARAAARSGGDVPGALEDVARRPGGSPAADLAALWRVAEQTGCPVAGPVDRLLAAHRAEEALRREVASQLAGPRATAALLAVLPLAGLAMGTALGADPVGFLTGTGAGLSCLVAGSALELLGLRWTRAIAASVTAGWDDP